VALQCCKCGKPVTNETANTVAPACDDCRAAWRAERVRRAVAELEACGYTVTLTERKE
jgi:hypothetical protein